MFSCFEVEEIQSEVRDPVLECVTRHEVTCHTSYVTNYVPRTGRVSRNCHEYSGLGTLW